MTDTPSPLPAELIEEVLDVEATAENIARHLSLSKGGRYHGPTYHAAKAGALMGIRTAALSTPSLTAMREAGAPLAMRAGAYDGLPPSKYFGDTDFDLRYPDSQPVEVTLGELRKLRAALSHKKEDGQ